MKWLPFAAALLLAACSKTPEPVPSQAPATQPAKSIAWIHSQGARDVDAAFAKAKGTNQPVFLFWTATWCPPCNHVKTTIFTRDDFIDKSRSFIPVYVDGDTPSGQALGKRFHVSGYPTMVLFRPDGTELTRLAGSVEPAKYMQLLNQGLSGGGSASQALAAAMAGKPVTADDWRLLGFYSWETDEQQLVPQKDAAATLLKLATSCPSDQREAGSRLVLQAMRAASKGKAGANQPVDKTDALASVRSVLARPELVREHYDLISFSADDIVGYLTLPKSKERTQLMADWNGALDQLAKDDSLSQAGRLWVVYGKLSLARLDNDDAAVPQPLVAEARAAAARADRETSDPFERQSVISAAADVLERAGLLDESDAMLKAELTRSPAPYYFMLGLADNATKRKTPEGNAAAIDWARQAYETSKGPATRLQWGGAYVRYLLEFTPQDAATIEKASSAVIGELQPSAGAFSARSAHTLERMSGRLVAWNKSGKNDAVLERLHAQIAAACPKATDDPADRAACESLFKPKRA